MGYLGNLAHCICCKLDQNQEPERNPTVVRGRNIFCCGTILGILKF